MNSFTPFVLGLLVLVGCCSAYIKDCNERLDMISEGAWPALGGFSSEVLNRVEVLAIGPLWNEASRRATHTVIHTTENRTYIRGSHSIFHLYGGVVTRELYELRGVPVKDIQMGGRFIAILAKDGKVWTAGSDTYSGQLGHHSEYVYYPVFNPVEDLPPVGQIAVGDRHSVVMTRNGTLMSWGYNGYAGLGYDTPTDDNPTPRKISIGQGTTVPRYICSGWTYSLAFMEDSTVITWGSGSYLGHPKTGNQPGSVHGLPDNDKVIQVSCGDFQTVALTEAGKLYAWGDNDNGQLLQADNPSPTARQLDLAGKIARDVVAGDDITIVRTYSKDAEFFGKVNGVSHRTMQVANGTDYPRDLMAATELGQRTWGAVRLGCVARNPCGN